jgi:hypothetical protein
MVLLLHGGRAAPRQVEKPRFDQYPATRQWDGIQRKPILNRDTRFFRTRIREAAKDDPNFAGHYVLLAVGCGAGCVHIYVIDKNTGTVWEPSLGTITAGLPCVYESADILTAHPDSRLLIINGGFHEDPSTEGTHYFAWTGKRFRLLYETPRKPCPPEEEDTPQQTFR